MKYWNWRPADGGYRNFGDELTGLLLEHIFPGERHEWVTPEEAELVAVGSVLHNVRPLLSPGTAVWGAGGGYYPKDVAGLEVLAVRGPATRDRCGLPAETVLGDPALLLPRYIPPASKRRHKLGIVRHMGDYRVYDHPHFRNAVEISALEHPLQVIQAITSCDYIASSSLHGWIVAVAYGIPAMPLPLDEGDKFYDFMQFLIDTTSLESAGERLLAQLQGWAAQRG